MNIMPFPKFAHYMQRYGVYIFTRCARLYGTAFRVVTRNTKHIVNTSVTLTPVGLLAVTQTHDFNSNAQTFESIVRD